MRPSGRKPTELRTLTLQPNFLKNPEGSCLIKMGDTHVICSASVENKVPSFLRNSGTGWITAEYAMLPRATATRTDREVTRGHASGRTHEIQRLIGRSLRSIIDMKALGERTIKIDCDVIQADGGTRTASITGAYVALHLALAKLVKEGVLPALPLTDSIAAVSCGIYAGEPVLDLDYPEDSQAETDANFVMTGKGKLVEIQATAEKTPFEDSEFLAMLELARSGVQTIKKAQLTALMEGANG
jgi:ribonuclease PH